MSEPALKEYYSDSDSAIPEEEGPPQILSLPHKLSDLADYIESLDYPETKVLGTLNGKEIHVSLTGGVPQSNWDLGRAVRGRCRISLKGVSATAYCIGIVVGTRTGILVSDRRMYAYTPRFAFESAWEEMQGRAMAEIVLDDKRGIKLEFLGNRSEKVD